MSPTAHYVVLALLIAVLGILVIWALKHFLWIGIGIVIGAVGHATFARLAPYWAEVKRRL